MNVKTYFKVSSHRFYGSVVALIMLVLYETLVIWGELPNGAVVRNAPEAWLRTVLSFIGISHYYISFVLVTAALITIPVFYRSGVTIKKGVILGMIIESIFWGIATGYIIRLSMVNLFMFSGEFSNAFLANLGLAIGAGLFEELLFRVLLTTFLIFLFKQLIPNRFFAILISVVIASFLFSLVHYMGNMADYFTLNSFMFRFFAGFWFTLLYTVRGFAITCMAHAFYDIYVIFFLA